MLRRRWRWSGLFAGFGAVNLALVMAIARPTAPAETVATASRLRLLSINVHTANTRADLVIAEIRRTRPDVVLLMEVDEPWLKALAPLRTEFPTAIAQPRADNFGIALLARVAVEESDIIELGGAEVPSIAVTVRRGEGRLRLLGTHPVPPGNPTSSSARNDQLQAIAEWSRRQSGPLIVLGDLNVTPWSPHFATLLREGGLKLSRPSWGVAASWPTQFPAGLRIPLDHCLISTDLVVTRYETGEPVGSDHLPLLVEVAVP